MTKRWIETIKTKVLLGAILGSALVTCVASSGCSSKFTLRKEVSRVASPHGTFDAVIIQATPGNIQDPKEAPLELYIVKSGEPFSSSYAGALLEAEYPVKNDDSVGFDLTWRTDNQLDVSLKHGFVTHFQNFIFPYVDQTASECIFLDLKVGVKKSGVEASRPEAHSS